MYIWSNQTNIEDYQTVLEEIYTKHSEYYKKLFENPTFTFRLSFNFGEYLDIGEGIKGEIVTREIFLEYVGEIAKNTPIISFEISHLDILQDPVSGHGIHLFPDTNAIQQMTLVNEKLFSGELGDGMYHERGEYVASANIGWLKKLTEANAILNEIQKMAIKIEGQVDTLIVSDFVKKDNERPKIEILESFKLIG